MIRTQVYLTPELRQNIRSIASKEDKAEAQVIRELLEDGIDRKKPQTVGEALLELAKLGKELKIKGPKDLSTNIDKYLYED